MQYDTRQHKTILSKTIWCITTKHNTSQPTRESCSSTLVYINTFAGNIFFKKKDYTSALVQYMDALKTLPYDPKTLLNIAQVTAQRFIKAVP